MAIDTINELKKHLRKIINITKSPDFHIFGYSIVKKSLIDDTIVCITALLPKQFKKEMNAVIKDVEDIDKYPSVSAIKRLFTFIRNPFFLSKNYYIYRENDVCPLYYIVTNSLERDIKKMESEAEN